MADLKKGNRVDIVDLKTGDSLGKVSQEDIIKMKSNGTWDQLNLGTTGSYEYKKAIKKFEAQGAAEGGGEKTPVAMRDFELTAYGKEVPELRGTFEYQSKRNEWKKSSRPTTNLTVDIGSKAMTKLGEKMSESLVEEHKEVQLVANAYTDLKRIEEQLMGSPLITGAGAEYILGAGKILQQMGFNFAQEPIANTEAYAAMMGNQVGRIIKQFGAGTGLSDADREYAEKIAGGKISLTRQSIEKIVAMNKKAMENVIAQYNKKATQAMSKPGAQDLPYNLGIDIDNEVDSEVDRLIQKYGK